jgi:hypothetical protein
MQDSPSSLRLSLLTIAMFPTSKPSVDTHARITQGVYPNNPYICNKIDKNLVRLRPATPALLSSRAHSQTLIRESTLQKTKSSI